jgi:hypothetical protein
MHNTLITAGAVAMAMALNSVATFAADSSSSTRTNSWQEGTTIEGKLVSLQAYMAKSDHHTSTGTDGKSPSRAYHDPSTAGTPAAFDKAPTGSPSAGRRDQADPQGTKLAAAPNTGAHDSKNESYDSAKTDILVLIAAHAGNENFQSETRSSFSPAPAGQQRTEQQNRTDSSNSADAGKAYILVFGDNSSGQAAFKKACGMISEGSSNWSASNGDAQDRQLVRGKDSTDSSERQEVAQKQSTSTNAPTIQTGQKNLSVRGSNHESKVKITGKLMSRGGIQAIQVSEISLAGMQSDSTKPNPTNDNRERLNRNAQENR